MNSKQSKQSNKLQIPQNASIRYKQRLAQRDAAIGAFSRVAEHAPTSAETAALVRQIRSPKPATDG